MHNGSYNQAVTQGQPNEAPDYSPPTVAIFLPALELRDYVTFYYFVTADSPLVDFLYPEWGNVRFGLHGDWRISMEGYGPEPQINVLFGPTDRCARVSSSGGRCVGFGLTPIGWRQLIGENAALMANRLRPLSLELGVDAEGAGSLTLKRLR